MLSKDCNGKSLPEGGANSGGACLPGVQVDKGARGMPRLSEAMKDAASCDNPRRPAHTGRSAGCRMGQPTPPVRVARKGGEPGELKQLSTRRSRQHRARW